MIGMFKSAGMSLRKWCSNSKEVLQHVPVLPEDDCRVIDFEEDDTVKTLGLVWNPSHDCFQFKCHMNKDVDPKNMTKRSALSEISKLFDPLGMISPLITSAKLFMQSLWQCKITWDEATCYELEEGSNKVTYHSTRNTP
uniref:Uncharacterized protein n=1 Tax=Cacopsylla melanoneura TaxID=428564 RepID=A0A8D8MIE5_9HEMI